MEAGGHWTRCFWVRWLILPAGLIILTANLLAQTTSGVPTPTSDNGISTTALLVMFTLGVIIIGVAVVVGLTLWSRKQDDNNNMMFFCIGYLFNTMEKSDVTRTAKALGSSHNPEALLVLTDVVIDNLVDENIRQTALDALKALRRSCPKYSAAVDELLSAIEDADDKAILGILKQHFEKGNKQYVQSAYLIGRSLLRLKQYEDAREWFRTAADRNHTRPVPTYGTRINDCIETCNKLLFAAGDQAFANGDYHKANELFAIAAHGTNHREKEEFSAYLRESCVYIKLKDYENAHEALLQALHHQQEVDLCLELSGIVSHLLNPVSAMLKREEKYRLQEKHLGERASEIMANLKEKLQMELVDDK